MARIDHQSIKDLLLNKSSISDYRIYEKDGNMVVHKLYKPDAEQLKTDERYKDVRANNKEFATCSAISSSLLATLPNDLVYLKKIYLQGTLTGLLKKLSSATTKDKGTRPICLSKHRELVLGIEFNKRSKYIDVCRSTINGSLSDSREQYNFCSQNNQLLNITADTQQANYYRFILVGFVLPDYEYNNELEKHVCKSDLKSPTTLFTHGEYISLKTNIGDSNGFILDLKDNLTQYKHASVAVCVGIEFFNKSVNGFNLIPELTALRVLDVLV
jgi:hypothetical protein